MNNDNFDACIILCQSRLSHLKKCSKELNVSPQTLRSCVLEQNVIHESKIASGDITMVEPKKYEKIL